MTREKGFLNEKGFRAYADYLAIKRHFTTKYDYFKYNGKVKVSKQAFLSRSDAYQFQKLSSKKDHRNLILANIVSNPNSWVGDLLDESGQQTYFEWKRKTDSITHHVEEQLTVLNDDFKSNFISVNGQFPYIINLLLGNKVSLEATTIIAHVTNSSSYWRENVVDKTVFPDIVGKIDKYHPFLVYSTEKMKTVLKNHFF